MIIGYTLAAHDNDSNMLGDETRRAASPEERDYFDWRFTQNGGPHPATCENCGRKTDPDYVSPSFRLRKKRLDVGSTRDGYTIVSTPFRNFCEAAEIGHIEFLRLPSQPAHFWFRVHRVLEVDTQASLGLRFLYPCDLCQAYAGVFGTGGLRFVGIDRSLPQGLSRTNLEFAQAHEQAPVIVLDTELASAMRAQSFRGLSLNAIVV